MLTFEAQVEAAVAAVRSRADDRPRAVLILGTGHGPLADSIDRSAGIPYFEIPHFPTSTALAHLGRLDLGMLNGVPVAAMNGRCHRYEGYSAEQLALPIAVMRELGAELLIVTNAAGGVNPQFETGDVMVIDSHINLFFGNPARLLPTEGPRPASFKPQPYTPTLIRAAEQAARAAGFPLHRGVYLAVTGPSYETRAEYRCFRQLGADAVGMSTVPEAIAAAALGMEVLGLSVITNVAKPDAPETVDAHHVVDAAKSAGANVRRIVEAILEDIADPTRTS